MVAADAFAFLFSSKVHGPKVGQHWEYRRIRGIKSGEVINVAARSNSPPKGEGGGDRFRRNVIEGTRVENVLDTIKRVFSYTPPDLLAIYYYLFSILIVILVGWR